MKNNLILDVSDVPTSGKWIILALQHVAAMFGATILVPILVNSMAGSEVLTIPVALFTSGCGTIIYIICTKGKSPVYLGSSFAFITPMALGFASAGTGGVLTGIMAVGILYMLVALIIKIVGKNWLEKMLPPIIVGPMIMIIGLGLAPSAVSQMGLTESVNLKSIIVILVTFLTTAIVALKGKGFLKLIPFILGILSGYVVSMLFGLVDFTQIKNASYLSVPKFVLPFLSYKINFGAIITILPVALVTIAEHIGDHTVLGEIIGKDLIKDPGLDRTLLGDGLATFVAGSLGGPANTTYGENTSVVGMTKVASVKVIMLAAIFAIIISFLGKLTAIFSTIPSIVLGSISLLLYGFISVNGLLVIVKNKLDFSKTRNVIICASMLVLGLGGAVLKIGSLSITGMSLAA
ncbi:MAG: NCS2 family nucleobase:cation symporter, partial [Firmicutes bacterium]|nr:NCS2 family nucleobase:cation symporter [Bacillota bacterium]